MDGLLEDGVGLLPGGLSRGVAVRIRHACLTSPSPYFHPEIHTKIMITGENEINKSFRLDNMTT